MCWCRRHSHNNTMPCVMIGTCGGGTRTSWVDKPYTVTPKAAHQLMTMGNTPNQMVTCNPAHFFLDVPPNSIDEGRLSGSVCTSAGHMDIGCWLHRASS